MLLIGLVSFAVLLGARAIPSGSTSGAVWVTLGIAVHTATASFAALTLAVLYFGLRAPLETPARV
jgi:hypothetical protein